MYKTVARLHAFIGKTKWDRVDHWKMSMMRNNHELLYI